MLRHNDKQDGSTIAGAHIRTGNVQLSNRHSVALTDITIVSQEAPTSPPIRLKGGDDKMEHLRIINIQDVAGTSLLFLANNFREAELLVCGLKLLLERETLRLGVRGGLPLTAFGYSARNSNFEGVVSTDTHMSPSAARGFRDMPASSATPTTVAASGRSGGRSSHNKESGYVSSDHEVGEDSVNDESVQLPDSRKAWGNVPGRNYMRGQAAVTVLLSESPSKSSTHSGSGGGSRSNRNASASNGGHAAASSGGGPKYNEQGVPHYVHGQQVIRDVARNVRLPLPLPLCRVLLLDSTSPVIRQWEKDRGDSNFDKSRWAFLMSSPTNSAQHPPRELERHSTEHQLIASGSMCGAYRSVSFDRPRYGSMVRLTETHAVDADDSKKLLLTIEEMNPRRGFSVCIRMLLRPIGKDNASSCDASIIAEIQPVGKDMSNQAAVHKAFLLVLDEIKLRYGTEGCGLLAGFKKAVDNMASMSTDDNNNKPSNNASSSATYGDGLVPKMFHRTEPTSTIEEKKIDYPASSAAVTSYGKGSKYTHSSSNEIGSSPASLAISKAKATTHNSNSTNRNIRSNGSSGLVSFEDMLKTGRSSPEADVEIYEPKHRFQRPSTPSLLGKNFPEANPSKRISDAQQKHNKDLNSNEVIAAIAPLTEGDEDEDDDNGNNLETSKESRLIEVKPLPKIRLSLMPSPREEDEDLESSTSRNKNRKSSNKKKSGDNTKSKKKSKRRSLSQRVSGINKKQQEQPSSSRKAGSNIAATIKKFSR